MRKRDYSVEFRRGKTMASLGQVEGMRLSTYLESLGITVHEAGRTDQSARISATDEQYSQLCTDIGRACRIFVITGGSDGARTAGTS